MDRLDLAVVIVTFNTRDLVLQCLQSVCEDADRTNRPYRMIVVDNASTDETATAIRDAFPQVRLIENSANAGPARAFNQGLLACADSDFVLLMNSDIKVLPGTLGPMIDYLESHPQMPWAIVGPSRVRHPNGTTLGQAHPSPSGRQAQLTRRGRLSFGLGKATPFHE